MSNFPGKILTMLKSINTRINHATIPRLFIVILFFASMVAAKKTDRTQNWSISGYIQVLYTYDFQDSAAPNNEFQVRRAKLQHKNSITQNVIGVAEIDCGQGELTVKDAGIECRVLSCLNFFLGQHKMPFSREELRPASKLLVVDRGEVNEAFSDHGYLGRDIGVTVEGDVGSKKYPAHYALGVFNGSGAAIPGDLDGDKQFTERITFGPVGDLSVGLNSTQRSDPITHDARNAYGGDILFQKRGWIFEAEVLAGQTGSVMTMAGGYVTGSCRIGKFEPAVKYERFYPDAERTDECLSCVTGNLGWHFNESLRLQADLISMFSPGQDPAYKIAAQTQLVF